MRRMQAVGAQVLLAFLATAAIVGSLLRATGTTEMMLDGIRFSSDRHLMEQAHHVDPEVVQQLLRFIHRGVAPANMDSDVIFSIAYEGKTIFDGAFVPMLKAAEAPDISIEGPEDGLFTWILVDLSAPDPDRPSHSPFLHYIVVNLKPGHKHDMLHPSKEQTVVTYYPVTPPIGVHLYVSLLYRQVKTIPNDECESKSPCWKSLPRSNFDVDAFTGHYDLMLVALTSFTSQPAAT